MKILVTNDDGIYARGLRALAEALQQVGEVVVVAPDREQSATSSAITMHHPVRFREMEALGPEIRAYAVEGTPADSVILALRLLLKDEEVALVFSGINEGLNLGDDVLLSGTVGAAMQGYMQGLPAVAFSVGVAEEIHFEAAARMSALLACQLALKSFPSGVLLNVNLPNLPLEQIEGIEVTKLARRSYFDMVRKGYDGKREYYWIRRGTAQWESEEGTDVHAINNRRVSITPLHSDLTVLSPDSSFLPNLADTLFQAIRSR